MNEEDRREPGQPAAEEGLAVPFRMTDLEEALFGPGGAAKAKQLLEWIDRLQVELQSEVRAGLPPDRFEAGRATANALAAARDLLIRFFKLFDERILP